jgi:hypothetical protein
VVPHQDVQRLAVSIDQHQLQRRNPAEWTQAVLEPRPELLEDKPTGPADADEDRRNKSGADDGLGPPRRGVVGGPRRAQAGFNRAEHGVDQSGVTLHRRPGGRARGLRAEQAWRLPGIGTVRCVTRPHRPVAVVHSDRRLRRRRFQVQRQLAILMAIARTASAQ